MKGGIYACDGQKCPICGSSFKDNGRNALVCPNHPDQRATKFQVRFGKICRRFQTYEEALRFLTGLRYKTDEGTFDERDYRSDKPLGFANLAEKWLDIKRESVRPGTFKCLSNYMKRAMDFWGNKNIKEIQYGDLEDFLFSQTLFGSSRPVSSKTRANMRSCLHDFWTWLLKRRVIALHEMPDFPEVSFELGMRKTIDKATQQRILDEIYRISFHINPKIWFGIRMLCTYIAIRPGELIRVREEHFDLWDGYLIIPHPKEKKPKVIPLLDEDVEFIKSLPRGLPFLPFFRHEAGIPGCRPG